MIKNNIGYIILEGSNGASDPDSVVLKSGSGRMYANATFQSANTRNRNGRWYGLEDLSREISCPRTLELLAAKALRSEQGHPIDSNLQRQSTIDETRCSVIITDLHMEGMDVKGTFTHTSNEKGLALRDEMVELGYKPAFSLRALGSVQQTRNGAEVHNLKFITYDQVIYPSHPNAYTDSIISESTSVTESGILLSESKVIPITNNNIIDLIKTESSNIKFVKECFDFVYESVELNKSGSKVVLTTVDGDKLVVNLENYVHRELMNYAAELDDKYKF